MASGFKSRLAHHLCYTELMGNSNLRKAPLDHLAWANCPRCNWRLDELGNIGDGPMPEDAGGLCSDPYGVHEAYWKVKAEIDHIFDLAASIRTSNNLQQNVIAATGIQNAVRAINQLSGSR